MSHYQQLIDDNKLTSHSCLGRTIMAAYGQQWKTLRELEHEIAGRWQVGDTQPTISARLREVQKKFPLQLQKQSQLKMINNKPVWFYRIVDMPEKVQEAA